jgi:hypothetical protein
MRCTLAVAFVIGACGGHPRAPHAKMSPRDIVKQSTPAIVRIEAGDDSHPRVGTGFVVDQNGLVATNLHVIYGESIIHVKMHDGSVPPVIAIAGIDKNHDLALLRVKVDHPLPVLRFGDVAALAAGDQIYAIGNPIGLNESVSDGLVSQVRELGPDLTILQISAPISVGSSGGPLLNQFGEVVGVTSFIAVKDPSTGAAVQNVNFAWPVTYLRPMIAKQIAMALDDFAQQTRERDEHANDGAADETPIRRDIPDHPVAVFDGCSKTDIEGIVGQIEDAIQLGAPEYNKQTVPSSDPRFDNRGFEKCYRIYEGTATKLERDGACKGVQRAFGDGLLKASSLGDFKRKAWAMRDTFDGILIAVEKWHRAHP